jgi:hypothetical protein
VINRDFLRLVLPDDGIYFMAHGRPPNLQKTARSIEELGDLLDEHIDRDVFFATATFFDNSARRIKNVKAKRAFYLDLDCGKGEAYADAEEAISSAVKVILDAKLPSPRLVYSGSGVHIWWPLTAPVSRDTWQPYADGLKNLCFEKGLHVDPVVPASPERLMRPPGAFNYENRRSPKPVFEHERFRNEPPVELADLNVLLSYSTPRRELTGASHVPPTLQTEAAVSEYRHMLQHIDKVEDYERWLKVGMALHTLGWEEVGYDLWTEWSKRAANYDEDHQRRTWDGFAAREAERDADSCTTAGTLHMWARDNGWIRPQLELPTAITMFTDPEQKRYEKTAYGEHCKKMQQIGWEQTGKGLVKRYSCQNAQQGLIKLGILGRRNIFSGVEEFKLPGRGWEARDDYTVPTIRNDIILATGADQGGKDIGDALTILANTTIYHPIREYLYSQEWDGRERLSTWLPYYCRAEDTPLYRYYGTATLVAAVRRALTDKYVVFPHMLVLIGTQNLGKSAVVRILGHGEAPEGWYKSSSITWHDNKSAPETFQGCWFYEWAELDNHGKVTSERIKSLLSATADHARLAYRRDQSSLPRHTIIIGTHNPQAHGKFINDQTGARRYWPVIVGDTRFRLEELEQDVDQLFAEALVKAKDFDPYFKMPPDIAAAADASQQDQTEVPRYYDECQIIKGEEVIHKGKKVEWISSFNVKTQYLSRFNYVHDRDVATAMRKLGWSGVPRWTDEGTTRGYIRPLEASCEA